MLAKCPRRGRLSLLSLFLFTQLVPVIWLLWRFLFLLRNSMMAYDTVLLMFFLLLSFMELLGPGGLQFQSTWSFFLPPLLLSLSPKCTLDLSWNHRCELFLIRSSELHAGAGRHPLAARDPLFLLSCVYLITGIVPFIFRSPSQAFLLCLFSCSLPRHLQYRSSAQNHSWGSLTPCTVLLRSSGDSVKCDVASLEISSPPSQA